MKTSAASPCWPLLRLSGRRPHPPNIPRRKNPDYHSQTEIGLTILYGQYIRQDGEWPIQTFLGNGREPPGFVPICRLDHLEYDLLASHYARLFGDSQVLVLPYEVLPKESDRNFSSASTISPAPARRHKPNSSASWPASGPTRSG